MAKLWIGAPVSGLPVPTCRTVALDRVDNMENEQNTNPQAMPKGFRWGAVRAGIKASGKLDVAVAVADRVANAAAMFTKNQVVAAPVTVGRRHLLSTGGRVAAVVVNAPATMQDGTRVEGGQGSSSGGGMAP